MTEVSIRHEFPSSVHVAVKDPKSERSAVGLARNFASKHYGVKVGHYVSSGYSEGAYTYVYSNPSYVDPPEPPAATPLVMPVTRHDAIVMPLKSITYAKPAPVVTIPGNARQRRLLTRNGSRFANA